MGPAIRNIVVVLVLLSIFGGVLQFIASGAGQVNAKEARLRIHAELQRFEAFDDHAEFLVTVLDREHDAVFRRADSIRKPLPDQVWETYRSDMYLKLSVALQKAGDEATAAKLVQYRSRSR